MKYTELDKSLKSKINGTLSSMFRVSNYTLAAEVYADFLDRKIFYTEIGVYYNEKSFKEFDKDGKEILDLKPEYRLDEEFLEDIRLVIIERFNKKYKLVDEKKEKNDKKEKAFIAYMKSTKSSDKQKRYAAKLYKQIYGEIKVFDDKDYSMKEMSDIIQELLQNT